MIIVECSNETRIKLIRYRETLMTLICFFCDKSDISTHKKYLTKYNKYIGVKIARNAL